MPEHVHLIRWPNNPMLRVRALLAAIKWPVSLPVSRRALPFVKQRAPHFLANMRGLQPNGRRSHRFWQRGGGYDRDLHDAGTIHATIDYLHANPVRAGLGPANPARAGLVLRPGLWRWSNAACFAGTGAMPLKPDVDSIPSPPEHWRCWRCAWIGLV